jgi:DNA-binding CsgD family transcriptional regulator
VCDLLLSETDQAALRSALAAEPVAGQPLPRPEVLQRLATLLHSDAIGAVLTDRDGYVVDRVELPHGSAQARNHEGWSDSLSVEYRNGRGWLVEVWWDRRIGEFAPRDVAVLAMITPVVQRLVRDATGPALPESLTVQERRTLMLLAAGFSNPEIAARLGVATSTVRKHLEHAYPKLGVTNRLGAAVAFRGGSLR